MKNKIFALLMVAIMILTSLPACGNKENDASKETDTNISTETADKTVESSGTSDTVDTSSPDTEETTDGGDTQPPVTEDTVAPPTEDLEHPLIGKLVINEICASNKTCLNDSKGNYYDWIEILNMSDEKIDLSGIGLSKKEEEPYALKMPSISLAPGTFMIIFCNKNEKAGFRDSNIYAPFNIGADGETLYLTAPAEGNKKGELLDVISIPKMKSDDVYGRKKDGTGAFTILSPTPNKSNQSAKEIKYISAPEFSSDSGFYNSEFELKLSVKGGAVYYTTDCSDPLTSDSAEVYRSAIKIKDASLNPNVASAESDFTLGNYKPPQGNVDKCTIIRAVAVDKDGYSSDVITKAYFVGSTAKTYSSLPIVSVSADHRDLFSGERGIYVVGDYYRQWVNSSDYVEYNTSDKRNPTNYNKDGREWEREATFLYFEGGKAVYGSDCGVRIAGNWSRGASQKSLRIYARGEYGDTKFAYPFFDGLTGYDGKVIDKFDKLTISSGGSDWPATKLVNPTVSDIVANRAIGVSAYKPCILFLNGEFWGMYFLCEKQDDEYIESHYGVKTDNVTSIKTGSIEGDSDIVNQHKKTMNQILKGDMTDPEVVKQLSEMFDFESLIDYIITETYIINNDWSKENGLNNWMMWRSNTIDPSNPYCDGRWRFILYDVDAGLKQPVDNDFLTGMNRNQTWNNFSNLFYRLCENKEFLNMVYERGSEIIEKNFDPDRASKILTDYATPCQPWIERTYERFGLTTNFSTRLRVLQNFINTRPQYAMKYLKDFCGVQ